MYIQLKMFPSHKFLILYLVCIVECGFYDNYNAFQRSDQKLKSIIQNPSRYDITAPFGKSSFSYLCFVCNNEPCLPQYFHCLADIFYSQISDLADDMKSFSTSIDKLSILTKEFSTAASNLRAAVGNVQRDQRIRNKRHKI